MQSLYLTVATPVATTREQGTAWLLWPDLVVTALHVVGKPRGRGAAAGQWAYERLAEPAAPASAHELRLPDGRTTAIEPLLYDPAADVALLRLPEGAAAAMPVEAFSVLSPERAVAGEPWHAKGYPEFEHGDRELAVGGVVSFVGQGLTNNTIQLFVDQGTSAQWGGISGSAAQNAWGEVLGVVVQTVAGIATCNAAPAEAVARLVRLLGRIEDLARGFEALLAPLSEGDLFKVLAKLQWTWLADRPEHQSAPAAHLAKRIVQAGEAGMTMALEVLRTVGAGAGAQVEELALLVRGALDARPTEQDRRDVLAALADLGGESVAPAALRARLGGMPAAVVAAALRDAYERGGIVRGPFGDESPVSLSAAGARQVARFDYERAALRVLRERGTAGATEAELAGVVPIALPALRRAMACAVKMGHAGLGPGQRYFLKDEGSALLERGALAPGSGADRKESAR